MSLEYNLQFFADGPGGEKTEPATQKKLSDARDKGQVAKSREIANGFGLLALFLVIRFWVGTMGGQFLQVFTTTYNKIPEIVTFWNGNIPVNGAVFKSDALIQSMVVFLGEYIVIAFRIALPIFCVMLLLNSVLGIMAKVSPQLNMFAVGIQFKVLVGLSIMFFSISMLPDAANFIFQEMKEMMTSFVGGMM